MQEQVALKGHAKVDLLANKVAVEIKALGSFGDDNKYNGYRIIAEELGWRYCYLSQSESHQPYRQTIVSIFRQENTFYLDTPGDWERFTNLVQASGDL